MNINVNSTQADSALALLPMFVPGALTSVQPTGFAHLGVPLVIYPATTGLAMVIDPVTTLSTTLAAFDTVVIWLNGQPTSAIKIIQPGEENDRILMYLPPGLLVNGINTMFYRVTRPSGNFEDSTPILNVLFNNPAPTITVSHPASIGPGQPAVITLTVGYARPYDTVTLTIGTWSITFTNPDPTKPITHTLTAAELQQIGNGTHPVSARVIDQLTNSNVSATTSITITANQKVYNPPIIVEAEANNRVLDVTALAGKDATIHALTWTGMVDGQPCWLKLLGFKADGSPHDLQLWNGLPAQTNPTWISQGKYPQPVLNSYLVQLGDGTTLTVQFWVSEDKSNNFAAATKFADQVYTVKALAAVVLAFLNGPYIATAGRQVTGIELLVTQAGQPSAGKTVSVTLPQGTTFSDGTSTGNFVTGSDGKVRLVGVTASSVAGTFSITAVSGGSTANASLTIVEEAPVGPIPLSSFAFGVAYSLDGKFAYTTGANYIQVIDTARSTVIKRIPVPATNSFEIALNQDASRAFVVDSGRVLAIDMSTNSLIADIPVAGWPIGIVLSKDGTQAFVSTWQGNSVVVINLVNFRVVKTIPVGPYSRGIDISPDGRRVYVANYGNGLNPGPSISVIDAQSLGVIRTVPLGPSASDVAVSPDGNSVYVCANASTGGQYAQSLILHLNTQTWAQVKEIRVPTYARCVALNHSGTRVYCSSSYFQTGYPTNYAFTTIDTASGQVISITPLRDRPYGIAISPDDSRALVACTVNDFLWAITLLPETANQGVNSADLSGITSVWSPSTLPTPDDPMFP